MPLLVSDTEDVQQVRVRWGGSWCPEAIVQWALFWLNSWNRGTPPSLPASPGQSTQVRQHTNRTRHPPTRKLQKWHSLTQFVSFSFAAFHCPVSQRTLVSSACHISPGEPSFTCHASLTDACDWTSLLYFCWQPEIPPHPTVLPSSPEHPESPLQRRTGGRDYVASSLGSLFASSSGICSSTVFPCISSLHLPENSPLC